MLIRTEEPRDWSAVRKVYRRAFETSTEAKLVDALRAQTHPYVGLVAEEHQKLVGHILFTPVELIGHPELLIMGLAPMAVEPRYQGQGIGNSLIQRGLEQCKRIGFGAVVVLGYPAYYPRFGFIPATRLNLKSEYDVPDDTFMVIELQPSYLGAAHGTIRFHHAFKDVNSVT